MPPFQKINVTNFSGRAVIVIYSTDGSADKWQHVIWKNSLSRVFVCFVCVCAFTFWMVVICCHVVWKMFCDCSIFVHFDFFLGFHIGICRGQGARRCEGPARLAQSWCHWWVSPRVLPVSLRHWLHAAPWVLCCELARCVFFSDASVSCSEIF